MKKLILLLTILNCSLTLAQEKTFSFDKKVSYKILLPDEYRDYYLSISNSKDPYLVIYNGKNAIIGSIEGLNTFNGFNTDSFFATNGKIFDVTANSLENNISIKLPSYLDFESENKPFSTNFFGDNLKIQKLNSTESINGFTCNNYELISINEDDYFQKTIVCIDEKNEINNISYLLPQEKIKGLIIKATTDENNGFIFDKITNSNIKTTFNEDESITNFNSKLAQLKAEYENNNYDDYVAVDSAVAVEGMNDYYSNDPINLYYEYAISENDNVNYIYNLISSNAYSIFSQVQEDRLKALAITEASTKKIIKEYKKAGLINNKETKEISQMFNKLFDAAKNFIPNTETDYEDVTVVEAIPYTDYVEESYYPYESIYKKLDLDYSLNNFAYTGYVDQENLMNTMPKYCTDNTIPNFSNVEFKRNVENYLGQLCDLYISKFVYNVGITETTDALRYSFIKINELKNKLSKEDQTKYDQYINSLD